LASQRITRRSRGEIANIWALVSVLLGRYANKKINLGKSDRLLALTTFPIPFIF
jgi:hypothetical protein